MSQHTMVSDYRSADWSLYVVETGSSRYRIAVQSAGGAHRCAVLRGISNDHQSEDSDPRVGESSLFAVGPDAWVGHSLTIGRVVTSPVVRVTREENAALLHVIVRETLAPVRQVVQPQSEMRAITRSEAEQMIHHVEQAARHLRVVAARHDLASVLAREASAKNHFDLALQDVAIMVTTIEGRRR